MLISNISVGDNYQSFETPRKNNYIVNAPGANILLGFGDAKLFENTIINNHSVTVPSAQILLGNDYSQSFETPLLKIIVSLHQVPRFC